MTEKVSSQITKATPENPEFNSLFKDIHYSYLDAVMQINILIELLGVYYHMIRTNVRELPQCIGRTDFPPKKLHEEFENFVNQDVSDVWVNFRYPDVRNFVELSSDEQDLLKGLLHKSALKLVEAFKDIYFFQRNFRHIYNKYKHTLSEFTGIFGIDDIGKIIQTQIYVRHKENNKVCTYIIPVAPDEVKYLNEISARVYHILGVLIDNALLHIVNEEKDFVPRTLFIDKEDETRFKELADKIQSCVAPSFKSKVIAKPPIEENADRINKELKEKHLYKMSKDILNPDSLLKQGVTVSK